ncbi:unnamed protein product [Knipowitschia caucasica]|uniref:Ig-like domain-containing protein n=1 Tax=Knipowitschia caucasica TaxID=637954 RepID=A0AAV2J2C2_KNICA
MVRSRPLRLLLLLVLWSHALESHSEAPHRQVALVDEACELACSVDQSSKVMVLQWSRPELDRSGYLLFYRHPHIQSHYQHPDYRARVQLKDQGLDHGDLSLVLKNVTLKDSGTYECRLMLEDKMWRRTTVQLTVIDAPEKRADRVDRSRVPLPAAALLLMMLILMTLCVVVLKRRARQPDGAQTEEV